MSEEGLQSFLDKGTSFEGKVAFSGVVRIDGHFRGEASADGTLVIGETGTVEADLELSTLIVHGTYRGKVRAKERIEVASTGVVEGSVTTPRLTIAEGASIDAAVHMGESP
jgi:cytoskeletal protein CcmA (bactofilin family)